MAYVRSCLGLFSLRDLTIDASIIPKTSLGSGSTTGSTFWIAGGAIACALITKGSFILRLVALGIDG